MERERELGKNLRLWSLARVGETERRWARWSRRDRGPVPVGVWDRFSIGITPATSGRTPLAPCRHIHARTYPHVSIKQVRGWRRDSGVGVGLLQCALLLAPSRCKQPVPAATSGPRRRVRTFAVTLGWGRSPTGRSQVVFPVAVCQ